MAKRRRQGNQKGNSALAAAKRAATRGQFTGEAKRLDDCMSTMKYRPEFCRTVIQMGASGASEAEMAVLGCGVVRATMREWAKKFPEFKQALDMANEASLVWWESQGRIRLRTRGFNTLLYNKIISCRFRNEYGEHLKLLGDANEPVAITNITRRIVDPRA